MLVKDVPGVTKSWPHSHTYYSVFASKMVDRICKKNIEELQFYLLCDESLISLHEKSYFNESIL